MERTRMWGFVGRLWAASFRYPKIVPSCIGNVSWLSVKPCFCSHYLMHEPVDRERTIAHLHVAYPTESRSSSSQNKRSPSYRFPRDSGFERDSRGTNDPGEALPNGFSPTKLSEKWATTKRLSGRMYDHRVRSLCRSRRNVLRRHSLGPAPIIGLPIV